MTPLSPTALEAAAKAMHGAEPWSSFWSTDDARLLSTAAITAYLAAREEEGFVEVRGAGSRHNNYIGLLRSLAECGGRVKLPHPIIKGYGPGYLERRGYAQWLRDSPRTASATGFAITEKGRAMVAAAQNEPVPSPSEKA